MKFDADKYEGWRKTILISYIKKWAAERLKKHQKRATRMIKGMKLLLDEEQERELNSLQKKQLSRGASQKFMKS